MAANNYYNFTHGGTQYGTQFTPPVPPASGAPYQTGYGGGAPGTPTGNPQAYAPPPQASDPYMIAGYTRPASGVQPGHQQGYYSQQQQQQQGMTGLNSAAQQNPMGGMVKMAMPQNMNIRPAATSTSYPTYSANTTGTTSTPSYAGFAPPQHQQQISGPGGNKGFTNYDAAVYNAVSAFAQGGPPVSRGGGGGMGYNKKIQKGNKGPRPMAKPQTLHYCDVCKISCAGPQTYKEHLEGQKHKKKEAAQKTGSQSVVPKGGPAGLRCELCDVTCTGADAYAAHIRGAKHQKVVKLHTKLGKPIPSDNPTVVTAPPSTTNNTTTSYTSKMTPITGGTVLSSSSAPNTGTFLKPAAPKISYSAPAPVGMMGKPESSPLNAGAGSPLKPPGEGPLSTTYTTPAAPGGNVGTSGTPTSGDRPSPPEKMNLADYVEKDVQPVGQDYIEEIKNEEGKVVSFNCKLCECRFNDPNAKEMHMKGRRHRLQYKKKVNPDLIVDVKPSSRQKKLEERRIAARSQTGLRKPMMPNDYPRGPMPLMPPVARGFGPVFGPGGPAPFGMPPLLRRKESMEDLYVMAKHAEIYPDEEELQAIQKIVSNTEKALKFVSDKFAEEDCLSIKQENGGENPPPSEVDMQAARKLKGVMRVGHLAKGLLLKGDREMELVVICSEKPTLSMLNRIFECLPNQMEEVDPEEKYDFQKLVGKAGIKVLSTEDPIIEVVISVTSPALRAGEAPGEAQATQVQEPTDLLDKEKCLDALAALRHAKWFQARATSLQSCVIVIRILRDLCRRIPAFGSLSCWSLELLAEKAINSAGVPVSPGEALRIIFEILASGFLLQFGPGLLDPCEKESIDALEGLHNQARQDITHYSQEALRHIAYRKIHVVLGIEPLSRLDNNSNFGTRKRRRDPSGNTDGDEAETSKDLKKDKKEDSSSNGTGSAEIKSETV